MEKRITGRTGMFCLIGTPVGHSGSPAMYNYSFAQTGLDYAYLAYDVPLEKTEEAVNALKVLGCKGFNVTMPCKTRVAELVDELSDAAKLILRKRRKNSEKNSADGTRLRGQHPSSGGNRRTVCRNQG